MCICCVEHYHLAQEFIYNSEDIYSHVAVVLWNTKYGFMLSILILSHPRKLVSLLHSPIAKMNSGYLPRCYWLFLGKVEVYIVLNRGFTAYTIVHHQIVSSNESREIASSSNYVTWSLQFRDTYLGRHLNPDKVLTVLSFIHYLAICTWSFYFP